MTLKSLADMKIYNRSPVCNTTYLKLAASFVYSIVQSWTKYKVSISSVIWYNLAKDDVVTDTCLIKPVVAILWGS